MFAQLKERLRTEIYHQAERHLKDKEGNNEI